MGSVTGFPRSGMTMTAWGIEFLGWNAKWISGYRGTSSLRLALERGEIGMTSFANQALRPEMLDRNKYTITYQSGTQNARAPATIKEITKIPLFAPLIEAKLKTDLSKGAFKYWPCLRKRPKGLLRLIVQPSPRPLKMLILKSAVKR